MRSSSTATACSCAQRMAPPPCARAKASTGPTSSRPSPRPPRAYPMRSSTARSLPLMTAARPTSPLLQAALSDGRSQDLVFFVFDLLFAGGEDLRALPLSKRKERLKALLAKNRTPVTFAMSTISRGPAMRCCSQPAACISKALSPNASARPTALAVRRPGVSPSAAQAMKS